MLDQKTGNKEFLIFLGQALLSLALSAVILLLVYVLTVTGLPEPHGIGPVSYSGHDFAPRIGSIQKLDAFRIELGSPDTSEEDRFLLTRRSSVDASDFPFLRLSATGIHAKQAVYLIWRSRDNPEQLSHARIPWSGGNRSYLNLANHPQWTGQIIEIGLDIYSSAKHTAITIESLALLPRTGSSQLATVWSEWRLIQPWTLRSINFLRGTTVGPLLSPTLTAAAWSGLSVVILLVVSALARRRVVVPVVIAVLIPWVVLDLSWQRYLGFQLQAAKHDFSGKSMHEKHLAEADSALYRYAVRLKQQVLPDSISRIFILHRLKGHQLQRLKIQYHLLPNNIYNFGKYPLDEHVQAGDFIMVLGNIPDLEYSPQDQALRWENDKALPVTLIDQDEQGMLYQVAGATL